MSRSAGRESLEDYVRQIGKLMNQIHDRLEKLETRLDNLSEEVTSLKATVDANKSEMTSLGGSIVLKSEFDEFVNSLTDSFKEILPPVSGQTEEASRQD